jgi:hypothetical protein
LGRVFAKRGLLASRYEQITQPVLDLGELRLAGDTLVVVDQTDRTVALQREVRVGELFRIAQKGVLLLRAWEQEQPVVVTRGIVDAAADALPELGVADDAVAAQGGYILRGAGQELLLDCLLREIVRDAVVGSLMLGRPFRPFVGVEDADRTVAFKPDPGLLHATRLDGSLGTGGEKGQCQECCCQQLGAGDQRRTHSLHLL